MNAANTCKRFWDCAESLKFRFRSVAIENTHHPYSKADVVSADNTPTFLRNFGHLVESVEWRFVGNQKRQDEMLKLLVKCCGKTLKRLQITNNNPDFNERSQLPALETLILYNAQPINFCLDSPLKYLEIQTFQHVGGGVDLTNQRPWFVRGFPHLETVRFNTSEITDATLTQFLSFNRQLRALEVDSEYLTPMIFESIGLYSRNIERLQIKSVEFDEFDSSKLHEELLHLSALRKLSEFHISGRVSLEILFKIFAENNVPIRSLEVDVAAAVNDSSLPTIKTLNHLQCICRSDIDEHYLVNLAKSQPALQTLQVMNIGSSVSIEAIEKILKSGRNLTNFALSFCGGYFELENYNRILMLARNRVEVRIIVSKRRQVNVPTDILRTNRRWLRIMFG